MIRLLLSMAVGLAVFLFIRQMFHDSKKSAVNSRLNAIKRMGSPISIQEERLKGSFIKRVLDPGIKKIVKIIMQILPINQKQMDTISVMLRQAGMNMRAPEYAATQVFVMLLGGIAGLYLSFIMNEKGFLYMVMGALFGYVLMRFNTKSRITRRIGNIEKELPEILDLLSVCVGAGLGFNQAIQYITEECEGELVREFAVVLKETNLGESRREALMAMSERCPVQELQMFVSVVLQAEELGLPLKDVLASQAEEVRVFRKMRIEEKAQKLPIKMMLPLVIFIFPCIFILLLGPAIPTIMEGFSSL